MEEPRIISKEELEEMMGLLKRKTPPSPEDLEFSKWIAAYKEKFDDCPPTEPGGFTKKEWCAILKECIAEGQTVEELLGIEYEEGCCD